MATQKKEVPGRRVQTRSSTELFSSLVMDWLFIVMGYFNTVVMPFNKVEESFNLHAIHDVLMYGVGSSTLHNYDHFTFPGAVPRTFVGSVLIGWLCKPVLWIAGWERGTEHHPKLSAQICARGMLFLLNVYGLRRMRKAIDRTFDEVTAMHFILLVMFQFHLPFWMGRTLPNMFALLPVTTAYSLLLVESPITKKPSKFNMNMAIALLTFAAVVFRAEISLLLALIALQSLYLRRITLPNLLIVGLVSGLASLCLTVTVDSYFWNRPLVWPELSSIYFNIYEGKSSEWGTSPPLAYFTTHLPKLLISSLPFSIIGFAVDRRIRTLLLPCFGFVALMSFLPHKEWRFIVYVIPMFTVAAARGSSWMIDPSYLQTRTRPWGPILILSSFGLMIFSVGIKIVLGHVSHENYPGGNALMLFHQKYPFNYTTPLSTPPHVHICNLAAQTGASLFMQFNAPPYHVRPKSGSTSPFQIPPAPWTYDKTENLSVRDLTLSKEITHLVSEVSPESEEGVGMEEDWELVAPIRTRSRLVLTWKVLKGEWPWEYEDKLWIYERKWSRVRM